MKEIVTNKTLEVVDLLTNQPISNYLDEEDIKVSFNNADINVKVTKPIDEIILKIDGILSGDSIEMTITQSSCVESSPEEKIELANIINGTIRITNPYEATIFKEEEKEISYYDELGLIRTDKKGLVKSKETLDCTVRDNLLESEFIRRTSEKRKKYII